MAIISIITTVIIPIISHNLASKRLRQRGSCRHQKAMHPPKEQVLYTSTAGTDVTGKEPRKEPHRLFINV